MYERHKNVLKPIHPAVVCAVRVFCWFGDHFAELYGADEGWTITDFFALDAKAHKAVRKVCLSCLLSPYGPPT
jgi:hypothetical protein